MPPLIELENAGKSYGTGLFRRTSVTALQPLSLALAAERPSIVAVVGESGSGKTTLGSIMLGLVPPDRGALRYCGEDVARMHRAGRRDFRRAVQAITQDPFAAYNPFYPVDHALTVPIRKFGLAKSRTRMRELAAEACAAVGLNPADTLGRYPHQLSGGQRQRLMVARALLLRPRLLVADEPVSMVDASLRATILASVMRLKTEHGISVVYITHDITTAYQVADEVLVLYRGHVVERGSAPAVIGTPRHPYTRLLVSSIPWPDLDRAWGDVPVRSQGAPPSAAGCPFMPRCPEAMAVCAEIMPAMTRYAAEGEAACHAAAAAG
jgi:oligopeptide/dipeptide ABC transporter ATP-binding protein